MNDDLLQRATLALRETSVEPEPRSGLTRARILHSAEARAGGGRSPWLRWALTVVGLLAAGSAFARLAQHWPEFRRALSAGSTEEIQQRPPHEPRQPTGAGQGLQPPSAAPSPVSEPAAGAAAPVPEQLGDLAGVEDELLLFRRARRLHLARDPQALGAWDDYLRVAPHGKHAPEARYSHAVCLVRAGRIDEARAELEPFARGEYQGFRKREARALLASEGLGP